MNVIRVQTDPAAPPARHASTTDAGDGGCEAAPDLPISFGEWRRSVWFPVLLKAAGAAALLATLAGVGVISIARGAGIPVTGIDANTRVLGEWIAPVASVGGGTTPAVPRDLGGIAHPHGPAKEGPSPGVTDDGRVVLNAATEDELTRIPGVGKKRAEAIVALRAKLTRFRKLSDLLRVRGIGPRSLKRIAPHVVLDAAKKSADGGA